VVVGGGEARYWACYYYSDPIPNDNDYDMMDTVRKPGLTASTHECLHNRNTHYVYRTTPKFTRNRLTKTGNVFAVRAVCAAAAAESSTMRISVPNWFPALIGKAESWQMR
jgi:hypothetical protein